MEEEDKTEQIEQTSKRKLIGKLLLTIIVQFHLFISLAYFMNFLHLRNGRERQVGANRGDLKR